MRTKSGFPAFVLRLGRYYRFAACLDLKQGLVCIPVQDNPRVHGISAGTGPRDGRHLVMSTWRLDVKMVGGLASGGGARFVRSYSSGRLEL